MLDGSRPILLVTHDAAGGWQFLCGTTTEPHDAKVIALKEAVRIHSSVRAVADLPTGWQATREPIGAPWVRSESG